MADDSAEEAAESARQKGEALEQLQQEKAKTDRQLDRTRRALCSAQLLRVDACYQSDPGQAPGLLHDCNSCPLDLRNAGWRYYERQCRRWKNRTIRGIGGNGPMAVSLDGQLLASASAYYVTAWNMRSEQSVLPNAQRHEEPITSLAFSPDDKTLATASWDQSVKLWNMETGKLIAALSGHKQPVSAIAFSPDGRTLASATYGSQEMLTIPNGEEDAEIRLRDMESRRARVTKKSTSVYCLAFAPDGKTFAAGGLGGRVNLHDSVTANLHASIAAHDESITSLAFDPSGKTLATATGQA
ncbi:MAG: WD40 repeat domain-containing protein [Planctomycetes bacterium]|nr:WD40 repeat domain-containing protein [Planctomycetota bacterium]